MRKAYDYLIAGAGLFGAVFAHQMARAGKKCLVIDKRLHRGGNIYCKETDGIRVHLYGAHIFHTDDKKIWSFVNQFVDFNRFINSPLAFYQGQLYHLPFNMNTFNQLWGGPYAGRSKREDRGATGGLRTHRRTFQPGGTGAETMRQRYLSDIDQRLYREAMGTSGDRTAGIYHPAYPFPVHIRQ